MKYHSGTNVKGSFSSGEFSGPLFSGELSGPIFSGEFSSGPLYKNEIFLQVEWVVIACSSHYPQNVGLV